VDIDQCAGHRLVLSHAGWSYRRCNATSSHMAGRSECNDRRLSRWGRPPDLTRQFGREQSPVPCRAGWRSSWDDLVFQSAAAGGDTRWDGPPQTATRRVTLANRGADDHTECRGRPTDSSRPTEIRAPRHGFGPPAALRQRRRRDRPPTCLSRVPHRPAWIVQGC